MKEIIFWGATGQAIVLHDFIERAGYRLVALFDKNKELNSPFQNIPLFNSEELDSWISAGNKNIHFAIAIGGSNGMDKMNLHEKLVEKGLLPATLIHDSAFVSGEAELGDGCQVLAQAAVIARTKLGRSCIVNTAASVDHECILGDAVHVAPGARVAGCVEIGSYSFIGTGAVVMPRIKIGENVIVGAGAVVTKNISSGKVAYGNPAKVIR
jgi:sugar O-acyltransferase (sialic acid O-acetyltransferase NeuD family)